MLIRRHRLRSELSADPVALFGDDGSQAGARDCQSRRTTASAAADDNDVGCEIFSALVRMKGQCRKRCSKCRSNKFTAIHAEAPTLNGTKWQRRLRRPDGNQIAAITFSLRSLCLLMFNVFFTRAIRLPSTRNTCVPAAAAHGLLATAACARSRIQIG